MKTFINFSGNGDVDKAKDAILELQKRTRIEEFNSFFAKIYHINKNLDSNNRFRFIECNKALRQAWEDGVLPPKPKFGISASRLPDDIRDKILNGEITTIIQHGNKVLFMDKGARSTLASKCNIKGDFLYDCDLQSDSVLAQSIENMPPQKHPLKMVYRKYGDFGLMLAVFNRLDNENLLEQPEWDDSNLTLGKWSVTDYNTVIEFEGKSKKGFVPVIRLSQSDAGNGFFKRELCVRNENNVTAVSLGKLSLGQDAIAVFEKCVNRDMNRPVYPKSVMKKVLSPSLGKKRTAMFVESFTKGNEEEILHQALSIPDIVGSINDTQDDALSTSLGNLFKTGI